MSIDPKFVELTADVLDFFNTLTGLLWRGSSRNNAPVCCCTAVAWWMGWLVGAWLGRWVGASCGTWVAFFSLLEADVVSMRLLCCVLLPFLATER